LQLITYVTSEPWFYRAGDSERKPPSFNGGEADVAPMMNEEGVQGGNMKASKNKVAMARLLQELRGESLFARLLRQLMTKEWPQHANEYAGDNADDDELRRLNRNYYGWMDFGKRSISDDDFNY